MADASAAAETGQKRPRGAQAAQAGAGAAGAGSAGKRTRPSVLGAAAAAAGNDIDSESPAAAAGAGGAAGATVAQDIVVQLTSASGEAVGPPISVPSETTPKQLEALANSIREGTEYLPFGFFVGQEEVQETVLQTLQSLGQSSEGTVTVRMQPLSVYHVLPVTRCSDTLTGHSGPVLHTAFSPDGTTLATGGGDCLVRLWDSSTNTCRRSCAGHNDHILATAFSPDGQLLASGDKAGSIRIWDVKSKRDDSKVLRGHKQWVTSLAWEPFHSNPEGRRLISASKDKLVRVWDAGAGRFLFSLAGHSDSVEAVVWGGNNLVYTASRDRSVRVWEMGARRGTLKWTLQGHGHRVNALAVSTYYPCRVGPSALALGGKQVCTAEEAAADYATVRALHGGERLVSCSDDFTMFLWDPENSRKPVGRLVGHQQAVTHVAFSPDGRYIASASFDKKAKVWDASTGRLIATLTGHVGPVYHVAWSRDSRFIATASKDSTVKVWRAPKRGDGSKDKAMHTLPGHADEVFALDWSPRGDRVASGSRDRTVKIWRH